MENLTVPTTFVAAWVVVLGLVALVIQAIANRPTWSSNLKRGVTLGVAALLGTVYMVATGGISAVPLPVQETLVYWFVVVAGIVAVGQAVYGYLKPYLDSLEDKTS